MVLRSGIRILSSKSNFSYDILDAIVNTSRTGHDWDELGMGSALETLCGQAFGAGQVDMLGVYMQRSWVILFVTRTLALWMIPQLFAYALNYPIAKFLQAQSKIMVMAYIAAANE
ncbi:multi antimicrobial extrusion protein [Tanacetum coccineum]